VDFSRIYVVGWVFLRQNWAQKYQWAAQSGTTHWLTFLSVARLIPGMLLRGRARFRFVGHRNIWKISGLAFCFCLLADQLVHPFTRCFPVECLSGSIIECVLHPDNLFGGYFAEICAFRPEIPNRAIGVLMGSPLPGTVRVVEIDLYFGIYSELLVFSHFLPPIIGQW